MIKYIAAALLGLSLSASSATAAERIRFNPGGSLSDFIESYTKAAEAESKFVIDGQCISACTLITAFIEPKNVCTTWRGYLVFHSPYFATPMGPVHAPEATRVLWHMYPPYVQEILKGEGWDGSNGDRQADLIFVPASKVYKSCDNG